MPAPPCFGTVVRVDATPRWARRDDGWWAGVAAALAVAVGLLTAVAIRSNISLTDDHVVKPGPARA